MITITWKTVPEVFAEEETRLGKEIKRCWANPQGYVSFVNGKRAVSLYLHPDIGQYTIHWRIRKNARGSPQFHHADYSPRFPYGGRSLFVYWQMHFASFPREFLTCAFYASSTLRVSKLCAEKIMEQAEKHLAEFRNREVYSEP